MSSAAKLMQHLSANCPKLRDMCIYPGEVAPYSARRYPHPSRRFRYQHGMRFSDVWAPLGSRIASLFSLTSLTISPAALLPQVFHAISKLENLETLRIRTYGSGPTSYDYKLDNLSFRALRTLELNHLEPIVLTRLCALQPLVSRLTDATVEFPDGENEDWGFSQDRVETTLYKLCPLSPQLVKLQFDVGWWDDFSVSQRLIDMLRPLPLRRLCLRYLQLHNQQECAKLCDALPLVEEFALPGASLRVPQLQLLVTKLPRLRILEVEELDLQGMDSTSTDKDLEKVASQLQNPMQIYAKRVWHGELIKVDDIARVLYSLWPGAVLSYGPNETEEMEDYTQINRIIFDLRSSSV